MLRIERVAETRMDIELLRMWRIKVTTQVKEQKDEALERALKALRSISRTGSSKGGTSATPLAECHEPQTVPVASGPKPRPNGAIPSPAQAISQEIAPESDFDPLDDLWQPFIEWFNARIRLDANAVAKRTPPKRCAGVTALHRNYCDWVATKDGMIPASREEFRHLLEKLGCEMTVHGEELVSNVSLKEDVEAQQLLADPLQPAEASTTRLRASRGQQERPVVVKPEPRYEFTCDAQGRPVMPHGVRLVRWAPLPSPARLSNCSTITDVATFIRTTLIQLDHALHNRAWLAGNRSVAELVIRLKAVGCYVALENPSVILQ
jgi:hypothetical protein